MNSNTKYQILRRHYSRLAKKAIALMGGLAILLALTPTVEAAQITNRSTTLGSSTPSASTTYKFDFTTSATAYTIRAIKFQVCDSPLQSVSCVAPTGASIATATLTANTGLAGFAISGTQNATQVIISEATGVSGNAATLSATFSGVSNPSTAGGVQFYTRITTYTDTAATAPTADGQDFGATAVATVPLFTVNANVQESLVFCVGATVGANCGGVGSAAITLTPDPLTTSAPSYGTAQMGAATNGLSGYSIAYYATNMVSGGNSITKVADGGAVSAAGGEQFGFTMRNQTSGNLNGQGSAASGGSGVVSSPYDSQNSTIAYDVTGPTTVASASGPTSQTTYTMLYAANVAATTEPGGYSATQTFIATATF